MRGAADFLQGERGFTDRGPRHTPVRACLRARGWEEGEGASRPYDVRAVPVPFSASSAYTHRSLLHA